MPATGRRALAALACAAASLLAGLACVNVASGLILIAALAVVAAGGLGSYRRLRRNAVRASASAAQTISPPWWAHPAFLSLAAGLPPVMLAWRLSAGKFETDWHTPKYFTSSDAYLAFALLLALALGAFAGIGRRGSNGNKPIYLEGSQRLALERLVRWLTAATFAGYIAWAAIAISRGISSGAVAHVVTGSNGAVSGVKQSYLRPVAGVTTFAEFGPVAIAALTLLWRLGKRSAIRWIVLLLACGLVRAILDAERLALLELAVPASIVAVTVSGADGGVLWRRVARWSVPLWIPVLLVVVFGGFEYIRSWSSFYRDNGGGVSYSTFALSRLEGYYATAENNSEVLLSHDPRTTRIPYYTAQWLWTFPVVGSLLEYDHLAGADPSSTWMATLKATANPEFNNAGGVLVPVFDFGRRGAFLLWAAVGFAIGKIYAALRRGSAAALLTYAVLTTGLLEIGRILYWPLGRAFPGLVGLLLVARVLRGARPHHAGEVKRRGVLPDANADAPQPA